MDHLGLLVHLALKDFKGLGVSLVNLDPLVLMAPLARGDFLVPQEKMVNRVKMVDLAFRDHLGHLV